MAASLVVSSCKDPAPLSDDERWEARHCTAQAATLREPPLGTVEHALLQLSDLPVLLGLRRVKEQPGTASEWLQTGPGMRSIGCCYTADIAKAEFVPTSIEQSFDALVFFRESTAEQSRLPMVRVE